MKRSRVAILNILDYLHCLFRLDVLSDNSDILVNAVCFDYKSIEYFANLYIKVSDLLKCGPKN